MSISEQVSRLRYVANGMEIGSYSENILIDMLNEAADTIESLSAKLQAADVEWHGNGLYDEMRKELKHSIIDLDADHYKLSEFMRVIDEVFVKYRNGIERPAADCVVGWILCEDRLPEDGVDVLVWFEYFRYGEYNRLFQTKGISYTYNGQWSGFVNGQSGWNQLSIIAWQPMPEDYHES